MELYFHICNNIKNNIYIRWRTTTVLPRQTTKVALCITKPFTKQNRNVRSIPENHFNLNGQGKKWSRRTENKKLKISFTIPKFDPSGSNIDKTKEITHKSTNKVMTEKLFLAVSAVWSTLFFFPSKDNSIPNPFGVMKNYNRHIKPKLYIL